MSSSSIKGEEEIKTNLLEKRTSLTSKSTTSSPATPRTGGGGSLVASVSSKQQVQPQQLQFANNDVEPDTQNKQSKQKQQQQPKQRRSQRASSTKAGTTLIIFFLVVLLIGSFQIFLYPPDVVKDDHWFDHQVWKVTPTTSERIVNKQTQQTKKELENPSPLRDNKSVDADTPPDAEAPSQNMTGNPILQVLLAAGLEDIERKDLEGLPSPETLTSLYGSLQEPVVIGMETCATFRDKVPPHERIAAVAGMFNTGTNAMAFHLHHNVNIKTTWQVPWGKHRMEFVRLNHTAEGLHNVNKEYVLPIILIRDPFYWMQSMCKSPYAAHWENRREHCPNMVPDESDRHRFPDVSNASSFPVKIIFDKNQIFYWDSLAHLWNDWYRRYVEAEYPRLMFRFEDLLFHGPTITKLIAECAGVTVPDKFKFQTGSAKSHGSHATFLDAIKKTGDLEKRLKHLTPDDLNFAAQNLDADLMRIFRYTLPKVQ